MLAIICIAKQAKAFLHTHTHTQQQQQQQQVRSSPGLLNLVKILAYHKRMAQEEVLTPDALKHVQGQIHDLSDTLKTILCL